MNDGLSPRWRETGETLRTLLTWLVDTGQWVEATAATAPQTEPEIPGLLADVASDAYLASASEVSPEEEEVVSPDLFTLLAALTALRQDVNLQTRSARHDREQTAQALQQVSQTVAHGVDLRQAETRRYEATLQETERAISEALVEVHDAFARATREAERLVASVATELRQWSVGPQLGLGSATETPPSRRPGAPAASPAVGQPGVLAWLRAHFRGPEPVADTSGPDAAAVLQQCRSAAGPMADRLEGLAQGYALSLQRLERLLATYGIAPIACLGQPVDAELMEVVQVVLDPSQPSGVVLDEVRRGYRRHGQVLRFAQVVATRAALPVDGTPLAASVERQEEEEWT